MEERPEHRQRPIPIDGASSEPVRRVDDDGAESHVVPTRSEVRDGALGMIAVGAALVIGVTAFSVATATASRLWLVAYGGWVLVIEGVRRLITGVRSVDLPPARSGLALLVAFGAGGALMWLNAIAIEQWVIGE